MTSPPTAEYHEKIIYVFFMRTNNHGIASEYSVVLNNNRYRIILGINKQINNLHMKPRIEKGMLMVIKYVIAAATVAVTA